MNFRYCQRVHTGCPSTCPSSQCSACCYVDEPIRFFLDAAQLSIRQVIKPVTPPGRDALPSFPQARA
jgi:hypothetical protein